MKTPAFQFYPKDWISSRTVRMMTAEQRGWYIQLLCEAWESEPQGTLPDDPEILWQLAGASSQQAFNARSALVISMFEKRKGSLINHRLCDEAAKQAVRREDCIKAGQASARARREAAKNIHLEPINGRSTDVQHQLNGEATLQSSASFSPSFAPSKIRRSRKVQGRIEAQRLIIAQSKGQL